MKWGDYEATPPVVDRPLHEVSRTDAEAAFRQLMAIKGARKAKLLALLELNGVEVEEFPDDAGVRQIGDWLTDHAQPGLVEADGEMANVWYVVAQDLGLLLGDVLIPQADSLEWRLFTGPKADMSYHRPVVMGFRQVSNSLYNYDPILVVANFAIAATQGADPDPDELLSSLDFARKLA